MRISQYTRCPSFAYSTHYSLPSSHLKTSFQWAKVVFCELSENLQFPTPPLHAVAPLSCFFYAETVTTKPNELRSVWGRKTWGRGEKQTRQGIGTGELDGWTTEGEGVEGAGKCKTKVNLNNKKPMGRNLNNEHGVVGNVGGGGRGDLK